MPPVPRTGKSGRRPILSGRGNPEAVPSPFPLGSVSESPSAAAMGSPPACGTLFAFKTERRTRLTRYDPRRRSPNFGRAQARRRSRAPAASIPASASAWPGSGTADQMRESPLTAKEPELVGATVLPL